jgi:microcystin-dependent protein
MSTQSPNLKLTIWNAANDQFDWTLLANNFSIIDQQFAAAGTQTVSNVPIRFIETLSTVPSTGNTDGRLVYLTATNGGFSANTIIQYKTSTTSWYEVGQPELVTQIPPSNHYLGRMIVFTASSGSFITGDVAVCTNVSGGTYTKVNKGVGTYTSITNAVAASPTAGTLAVLTAADANLGAGGPYAANSLIVYNSADGRFQPIAGIPAGAIQIYAGVTVPPGWLLCNGASCSSSDYPNLWRAIGNTYGGSNETAFLLPDLRGRIPVGYAASGGHADVSTLGNNDGVAPAYRRAKHNHTVTDPGHTHPQHANTEYVDLGYSLASTNNTNGGATASPPRNTQGAYAGITVGVGGTAATDAPAYIVLNYIIKV